MAEDVCHQLEAFDFFFNKPAAGLLWVELRGLLASDIEVPEPCPDSLGDEDRATWAEYNRDNEGEEISETKWLEFEEDSAQAAIEDQLESYPFPSISPWCRLVGCRNFIRPSRHRPRPTGRMWLSG